MRPAPPAARRIYACDVGSTNAGSFAWATVTPGVPVGQGDHGAAEVYGSCDLELLVAHLRRDLALGTSVALGFEAPLFVPVPTAPRDLFRRRRNEPLAWCGGAGALITAQAVHLAAWILRAVRPTVASGATTTLATDCAQWAPAAGDGPVLLCWEAFVSGEAHAKRGSQDAHVRDAATAAVEFARCESDLRGANAVLAEHPLSLIGAAALWSGWTTDPSVLRDAPVVLRPAARYDGEVMPIAPSAAKASAG